MERTFRQHPRSPQAILLHRVRHTPRRVGVHKTGIASGCDWSVAPRQETVCDLRHVSMELRGKTIDRFQLPFKVRAEIEGKRGVHIPVARRVQGFLGTVRFSVEILALESRCVTSLIPKNRRSVVIRVTALPAREYAGTRPLTPDLLRHSHPVFD